MSMKLFGCEWLQGASCWRCRGRECRSVYGHGGQHFDKKTISIASDDTGRFLLSNTDRDENQEKDPQCIVVTALMLYRTSSF